MQATEERCALMQTNAARLAFGRRQPSASITFGSQGRQFFVVQAGHWRDPRGETL